MSNTVQLPEIILRNREFLDRLTDEELIMLCQVSISFQGSCADYLRARARQRFGALPETVTITNWTPEDYLRVATRAGDVLKGSERYISLEDAYFRALMKGDFHLIDYFAALIQPCYRALFPMLLAAVRDDLTTFQEWLPTFQASCPQQELWRSTFIAILLRTNKPGRSFVPGQIYSVRYRLGITAGRYCPREAIAMLAHTNSIELVTYLLLQVFGPGALMKFLAWADLPFVERFLQAQPPDFTIPPAAVQGLMVRGIDPVLLASRTSPEIILNALRPGRGRRPGLAAEIDLTRYLSLLTPQQVLQLLVSETSFGQLVLSAMFSSPKFRPLAEHLNGISYEPAIHDLLSTLLQQSTDEDVITVLDGLFNAAFRNDNLGLLQELIGSGPNSLWPLVAARLRTSPVVDPDRYLNTLTFQSQRFGARPDLLDYLNRRLPELLTELLG